ncbi:MAG: hydrolase [Clostridia bacterium]|nr:hydrolase [Clostridia bacterium]
MKLRNMTAIYIFNEDKILMLYRIGSIVFTGPLWTGVGGHFEDNELNEPEKCILRELFEETGITVNDINGLNLKYITIRKSKDEIRQQYIYFAELINKSIGLLPCNEGNLEWVHINDILKLKMSFTNYECLKHYFSTGKNDDYLYSGVVNVINDIPKIDFISLKDFKMNY